jgi:hypothetical protein
MISAEFAYVLAIFHAFSIFTCILSLLASLGRYRARQKFSLILVAVTAGNIAILLHHIVALVEICFFVILPGRSGELHVLVDDWRHLVDLPVCAADALV